MPAVKAKSDLQEKIDRLDAERASVKSQLDRERLTAVTNQVIETITSDAFIERMRKARERASDDDGFKAASELLSLEGLRRAGAEIPDDFRLTSRVFEDKVQGLRWEIKPDLRAPHGGALGWGACAGAGGLTFCGCGGFST
jgi:hypothetical protein